MRDIREAPLRRVVAVVQLSDTWRSDELECGHSIPTYENWSRRWKARRCRECEAAVQRRE